MFKLMYVGSGAESTTELDSMRYNSEGKAICNMVQTSAEKAQESEE